MKKVKTWEAKIYCGLRQGYGMTEFPLGRVHDVCCNFVNEKPWCVTITRTMFTYTGGWEDGAIVGIIQYPRFPDTISNLKEKTLKLAQELKHDLVQLRVSVVFPDVTFLLE